METFKPEQYERRREMCEGWEICITSYKLRDRFYCKIDNVDPGANVARAQGATREEAERDALRRAQNRLALTRRIRTTREVLHNMQSSVQRLTDELAELERASQSVGQSDPDLPPVLVD
jgi:hypothetical protein